MIVHLQNTIAFRVAVMYSCFKQIVTPNAHAKVSRDVFFCLKMSLQKWFFVSHPDLTYERTSVVQRCLINFSKNDLRGNVVSFASIIQLSLEKTYERIRYWFLALCPLFGIGPCGSLDHVLPESTFSGMSGSFVCTITRCINRCDHLMLLSFAVCQWWKWY